MVSRMLRTFSPVCSQRWLLLLRRPEFDRNRDGRQPLASCALVYSRQKHTPSGPADCGWLLLPKLLLSEVASSATGVIKKRVSTVAGASDSGWGGTGTSGCVPGLSSSDATRPRSRTISSTTAPVE